MINKKQNEDFLCLSTVMPCTLQIKTGSLRAKEPCKSSKRPGYLGIYPWGEGTCVHVCMCMCRPELCLVPQSLPYMFFEIGSLSDL